MFCSRTQHNASGDSWTSDPLTSKLTLYHWATVLLPFVCLIWFFTSQSTIFQLCRDSSSWVEPVLSKDKCVLLKDTTQWRQGGMLLSMMIVHNTLPLTVNTVALGGCTSTWVNPETTSAILYLTLKYWVGPPLKFCRHFSVILSWVAFTKLILYGASGLAVNTKYNK